MQPSTAAKLREFRSEILAARGRLSGEDIAEALSVEPWNVWRLWRGALAAGEVTPMRRPRGVPAPAPLPAWRNPLEARNERIRELVRSGLSFSETARACCCVSRYVVAGVVRRGRRRAA